MFELKNSFGAYATHILDGVLVANIVGTFNGIVHMPTPIIVGISACNRARDSSLSRHRVRARGKYFRNNRRFITRLR